MQKIVIIPACEEFIDSYYRTVDFVASEKKFLSRTRAYPFDETEAFIKEGIEKGYPYFFALSNNQVIGWCDIKPLNLTKGMLGIGVLKNYRGNGIGKKLILTALNGAKEYGFSCVELEVRISNKVAINLYHSMGFVISKKIRNGVNIDGEKEDLYTMTLNLE